MVVDPVGGLEMRNPVVPAAGAAVFLLGYRWSYDAWPLAGQENGRRAR